MSSVEISVWMSILVGYNSRNINSAFKLTNGAVNLDMIFKA